MQKDILLLEFRLANQARALSPRTIRYYDDNLNIFFSYLQQEDLPTVPSQITPSTIRSFLASREVAPSTLHVYYRVLRRFFNFLSEEGYLVENPMDRIKAPRLPKLQPRYLSKEEVRRFFEAIDTKTSVGVRNHSLFLLFLDTGARVSEALSLEMSNLDLENGRAFIRGKGAKERHLFFGHRCARTLAKYVFHHRPKPLGSDYVFLSSTGSRLDQPNVWRICQRIARRANVKKVYPHCFRHTFATAFLENGGSELALQRLLGHSSLEMVARYAHITRDHLAKQHKLHSPGDHLLSGKG